MNTLVQDVKYALRVLKKSPGVTLLAIGALALGIGANAAIFSVADALLLRPEPFPNLSRLVLMYNKVGSLTDENSMYPADVEALRARSRSFEKLAAYAPTDANLSGEGNPERVEAVRITPNFFDVLGVQPLMGRGFAAGEAEPGNDTEAILSYGLWQSKFGGEQNVIGKQTHINGRSYTIVGVMGSDFDYPVATQLWEPLGFVPADKSDRDHNYLFPVGLLNRGVSASQAATEVDAIGRQLGKEFPRSDAKMTVRAVPFRTYATDELTHEFMLLLLGAVGFVLLIACANVANLQLARVAGRDREIALRAALGASRWRVVRQLLTESVILALAGAAAGLFLANWAVELTINYIPAGVSRYIAGWNRIALDWRAVLYTVALAVLAGIIAGLAPALGHSRPDLSNALKEGGRGGAGRTSHRLRSALVVAEVAASLVLLIAAGLLTKGFRALLDAQTKFSPESLLIANINLPANKYPNQAKRAAFYQQALANMSSIPGVESASFATAVPNSDQQSYHPFTGEGRPWSEDAGHIALRESVSPSYFRTLHLALLQGREFTEADGPNTLRVAMISRSIAERYWPGERAVGKRIKVGRPDAKNPWMTIVGVVADVKYNPYFPVNAAVYMPYMQDADMSGVFLLRTAGDPLGFVSGVRAKIASIDPDQPIYEPKTLAQLTHEELVGVSFIATMMGVLGLIALVLACSGVYGVMAHSVTERTHEIGIRLALGAEPREVLQWIAGRGMRLAAIGLAIGLALAFAIARLMSSIVFGVSATDPLIFAGIPAILGAVALAACYLPARRAMKVDPIVALRYE